MRDSLLRTKSYAFAVRIIRLSQFLKEEHKEYVLSKQIMRSGTAIGALIHEAEFGQSRPDFRSKRSIALKETNETHYWISLLQETDYINHKMFGSLSFDCVELIKILVASVKTSKKNDSKEDDRV